MEYNKMTNEELIEAYRKTNCERVLTQLYNNNTGIIYNAVNSFKHYDNITLNTENYLSMAQVGFMKAVKGYNPKSGNKFSTLLAVSAKREIQRLFRDNGMKKRNNGYDIVSMQSKPFMNSTHDDFSDFIMYEEERFTKPFAELNELYDELKPLLTEKQLYVLDRLNNGFTELEIANELNTSHQNIHARIRQIRSKIVKLELAVV